MFKLKPRISREVFPYKVYILLAILNTMQFVETRTVFNELIPSDPNCSRNGEHGCLCYGNTDCDRTKYLECIDGKCVCEFPLHRIFDTTLGKCVSLVGSYCGAGSAPECVKNSECDPWSGRCSCREGYSRTSRNNCSVNFQEDCGPGQCNAERGLGCKENKCQCVDSAYVYSVIHARCIDPEAVVREFVQRLTQRIIQGFINFKVRKIKNIITLPLRVVSRLALGPFG